MANDRIIIDITANNQTSGSFREVGVSLADMSKQILTATAGLVGLNAAMDGVKQAVQKFAAFETQLAQIKVAASATNEQMRSMEKNIAAISAQAGTIFTKAQIADGMLSLAKAGKTASEQMAMIKPVMDLAAAGMISVDAAADAMVNTMSTFNLAMSEANALSDLFVQGANASTQGVQDMVYLFTRAGSAFKSVGLSVRDLATLSAVLADVGLKGERSADGVNNFASHLVKLQNPSKSVAEQMSKFGITFDTINPAVKNMAEIIEVLNKTQLDLVGATTLFGDVGGRVMLPIIQKGASAFRDYEGKVRSATGAHEAAMGSVGDLEKSFKDLQKAVEAAAHAVGETLSGATQKGISQMSEITRSLADFLKSNQSFFQAFVDGVLFAVQVVIGSIDMVIQGLRADIDLLAGSMSHVLAFVANGAGTVLQNLGFSKSGNVMKDIGTGFTKAGEDYFKGFDKAADRIQALNAGWGKALFPENAPLATGPLSTVGGKIDQKPTVPPSKPDPAKAQAILDQLKLINDAWQQVFDARSLEKLGKIVDSIQKAEDLKQAWGDVDTARSVQALQDAQKQVYANIAAQKTDPKLFTEENAKGAAKDMAFQMAGNVRGLGAGLNTFTQTGNPYAAAAAAALDVAMANEKFKASLDEVNKAIGDVLAPVIEAVTPAMRAIGDAIKPLAPLFRVLGDGVRLLVAPVAAVARAFQSVGELLFGDVKESKDKLSSALLDFTAPFKVQFDLVKNAMGEGGGGLFGNLLKFFDNLFTLDLKKLFENLFKGISIQEIIATALQPVTVAPMVLLVEGWDAITTAWRQFWSNVEKLGKDLGGMLTAVWDNTQAVWNWFWTNTQDLGRALGSALTAVWDNIQRVWNWFWTEAQRLGNVLGDLLSAGWTEITKVWRMFWASVELAGKLLQDLLNSVGRLIGNAWGLFWDGVKNLANGLWSNLDSVWRAITGAWDNLWDNVRRFAESLGGLIPGVGGGGGGGDANWLVNPVQEGISRGFNSIKNSLGLRTLDPPDYTALFRELITSNNFQTTAIVDRINSLWALTEYNGKHAHDMVVWLFGEIRGQVAFLAGIMSAQNHHWGVAGYALGGELTADRMIRMPGMEPGAGLFKGHLGERVQSRDEVRRGNAGGGGITINVQSIDPRSQTEEIRQVLEELSITGRLRWAA